MAMDQKNEKDTQGKRKSGEKRGFYIALAVCLAAIGIAAWSTYDTVSGFLEPVSGSAESTSSAAAVKAPAAKARRCGTTARIWAPITRRRTARR